MRRPASGWDGSTRGDVLDLFLPDLDGYTLASQLRADPATTGIPVILITGADVPITRTLSLAIGAVAHLPKPFTAAQLLRAVGVALGRQGA